MKILRTATLVLLACWTPTRADIVSDLESFYDNTISYGNVTPFSAYSGQTTNMVTPGGVTWRVPAKNVSPFSVQVPRVRMGCGGIDLFMGGFSFINASELINLLRNIGSGAAVSYGLMIALKVISPDAESLIETLQDWAQKANAMNITSCEAARSVISGAFKTAAGKEWGCISSRLMAGDDYQNAKKFCGAGGGAATTAPPASEERSLPLTAGNLVWKALTETGFTADRRLAEAAMSLTGTVILRPQPGGSLDKVPLPPMIGEGRGNALIRSLLYGGRAEIYQCDTTPADGCLNPALTTITIPRARSLKSRIYTQMLMIAISIFTDTPPANWGSNTDRLIESAPYPIYRYLTTMVATGGATLAIRKADLYAEMIAYQILQNYLADLLQLVVRSVDVTRDNKDDPVMEEFRQNVAKAIRAVELTGREIKNQVDLQRAFTDEMMLYQKMLAARVPASSFNAVGKFQATTARAR